MGRDMKASDLVRELQAAIEACGDREVLTVDSHPIEGVCVRGDTPAFFLEIGSAMKVFAMPLSKPWLVPRKMNDAA